MRSPSPSERDKVNLMVHAAPTFLFSLLLCTVPVEILAGGSAGPVSAVQAPPLVVGEVSIFPEFDGIRAMRGGVLLWRNVSILEARLTRGPGRWITAEGVSLATLSNTVSSGFDVLQDSFVLDPLSGEIKVEVKGQLIHEEVGEALFLKVVPPTLNEVSGFLTVTRLPLKTMQPEVRHIKAVGLLPDNCLEKPQDLTAPVASAYSSITTTNTLSKKQMTDISIGTTRCEMQIRLDFATLKVSLLSFKSMK